MTEREQLSDVTEGLRDRINDAANAAKEREKSFRERMADQWNGVLKLVGLDKK